MKIQDINSHLLITSVNLNYKDDITSIRKQQGRNNLRFEADNSVTFLIIRFLVNFA